MNEKLKTAVYGLLAGGVAGVVYFYLEESGVPKGSNAQYLAPASTDVLAWAFGALIAYKGVMYKDPLLSFTGAALIGIHGAQFAAHKVISNRL